MLHTVNRVFKLSNSHRLLFLYNIISIVGFAIIYYLSDILTTIDTHNKKMNAMDALYFSTVTQTTLGFGDIVPIHGVSKVVVMLQCITVFALLYLVR